MKRIICLLAATSLMTLVPSTPALATNPNADLGAVAFCKVDVPTNHPDQHLGDCVQVRFARRIAVCFMRQRHVADRRAMPLERHVEPLRLNREGAGVVVGLAVNQEDRLVDLVGVKER